MFYFCIFYIIPCLWSGYLINQLYSEGQLDYVNATVHMLAAIVPLINIVLLINLLYERFNRRS